MYSAAKLTKQPFNLVYYFVLYLDYDHDHVESCQCNTKWWCTSNDPSKISGYELLVVINWTRFTRQEVRGLCPCEVKTFRPLSLERHSAVLKITQRFAGIYREMIVCLKILIL